MSEYNKAHLSRTSTPRPTEYPYSEADTWNTTRNDKRSSIFDLPLQSITNHSDPNITTHSRHPMNENIMTKTAKPKVVLENTYKMENRQSFPTQKISKFMEDLLNKTLQGMKYDQEKCPKLSISLASDIKQNVKDMNNKRYKIVTEVTIGQKKNQDVRMASRCVWNTETDSVATAIYENSHIYAVALAFGLYYE